MFAEEKLLSASCLLLAVRSFLPSDEMPINIYGLVTW